MVIERRFIERGMRDIQVTEFLKKEFERADFSHVEIRRTPLSTRITIWAGRPGIIIGRAGTKIKELTDTLQNQFKIDNPQLEVKVVERPELDAKVVARQIASALERGLSHRRIANSTLQQVMGAGALGIEIRVGGKLSGERSRAERFVEGYIKKCGEPALQWVEWGYAQAKLKPGVLGIQVGIMKSLPLDMLLEKQIEQLKPEEAKAEGKVEEKKAETRKKKEPKEKKASKKKSKK